MRIRSGEHGSTARRAQLQIRDARAESNHTDSICIECMDVDHDMALGVILPTHPPSGSIDEWSG